MFGGTYIRGKNKIKKCMSLHTRRRGINFGIFGIL